MYRGYNLSLQGSDVINRKFHFSKSDELAMKLLILSVINQYLRVNELAEKSI